MNPPCLVKLLKRLRELVRLSAIEYLERVAADIQESVIKVETVVVDGVPHEEILRFAEQKAVDLIVISSRGQFGLNRWIMGSVADQVIRGTNIPVLKIQVLKQGD